MSQGRLVALLILVPLLTFAAVSNLMSVSRDDLWHYLILALVFAALAIGAAIAIVREFVRRGGSA